MFTSFLLFLSLSHFISLSHLRTICTCVSKCVQQQFAFALFFFSRHTLFTICFLFVSIVLLLMYLIFIFNKVRIAKQLKCDCQVSKRVFATYKTVVVSFSLICFREYTLYTYTVCCVCLTLWCMYVINIVTDGQIDKYTLTYVAFDYVKRKRVSIRVIIVYFCF